ncbi:MAG TPA: hypothetical protein VK255_03875 [Patescibacteria group bacterium]|nr:hypothetical protein [Patescibacteria group bacterium]
MAASYMKEIVTKRADELNIELLNSDKDTIFHLNRSLDREEMDFIDAMTELRKKFGSKFTEADYKYMGNEIHRKLYNKPYF